jgi:hypothetical protein
VGMKKTFYLLLTLFFLSCCSFKQDKVERYMEDDVEIVVNRLKPYKIDGEPGGLILEEEFTIDTEKDGIEKIGLTDIDSFDVDSDGNIFIKPPRSSGNFFFKFNRNGCFISSFGRKGQGPGELHRKISFYVNNKNEIVITVNPGGRLLVFSNDGKFIKETQINDSIMSVIPLDNGKYLIIKMLINPDAEYSYQFPIILCDSEFEEIKELDRRRIINPLRANRIIYPLSLTTWKATEENIYIGDPEKGYEISVYDLEGNLLRKIRKDYKKVVVSEEYKKQILRKNEKFYFKDKLCFSKYMPPYLDFFPGDRRRLLVKTYERGKNLGEYIYDVFNPTGVFIGRTNIISSFITPAIKNGRLYCIREKESNYKELVVYKVAQEE